MKELTETENDALLLVFKEFSSNYNANSISKLLGITPRGALKILKALKNRNIMVSKRFGKATFYKVNFSDYYTLRKTETLLVQEAQEKASRWLAEFKELFHIAEAVVLFGSMTRAPKTANDVDLVIVVAQKNFREAENFVRSKNRILLKPIHPVYQSPSDIKDNLKKRQPVLVNALKQGYVLHGYEKLIEAVKDATSFE